MLAGLTLADYAEERDELDALTKAGNKTDQYLHDLLTQHGISYTYDPGNDWSFRLANCPFCSHPTANPGLKIWNGLPCFHCFHADCVDKSFHDFAACFAPTIRITTNEKQAADEVTKALASADIYERGNRIVSIAFGTMPPKGLDRPPDAPRIKMLELASLRELISSVCKLEKWNSQKKEWQPAHPPEWLVHAIYHRGEWGLRRLEGIVETPFLRADKSIITQPGYDEATGVYFMPSCHFPVLSAAESLEAILDILHDFPFVSDAHRSAAIAAILTPFSRFAFHGPAPLFLIDGNTAGCGKGLLADVVSLIYSGGTMPISPCVHNEDETRKRILAFAIVGEMLVMFDDIQGAFGNGALNAALTATNWSDRLLGKSKSIEVPLNITWYGSGNNIAIAGDMVRRTLHVRMESPLERPQERTGFRHDDLKQYIRDNRGRLASAALTLLSEAKPQKLKRLGSFEAWSDIVRAAIVTAGQPDPIESVETLHDNAETDLPLLQLLIEAWEEADPKNKGLTLDEALKHPTPKLKLIFADIGGKTEIAYKMRALNSKVVGGKKLVNAKSNGRRLWKVA